MLCNRLKEAGFFNEFMFNLYISISNSSFANNPDMYSSSISIEAGKVRSYHICRSHGSNKILEVEIDKSPDDAFPYEELNKRFNDIFLGIRYNKLNGQ